MRKAVSALARAAHHVAPSTLTPVATGNTRRCPCRYTRRETSGDRSAEVSTNVAAGASAPADREYSLSPSASPSSHAEREAERIRMALAAGAIHHWIEVIDRVDLGPEADGSGNLTPTAVGYGAAGSPDAAPSGT